LFALLAARIPTKITFLVLVLEEKEVSGPVAIAPMRRIERG
jgi:hypothetical protein